MNYKVIFFSLLAGIFFVLSACKNDANATQTEQQPAAPSIETLEAAVEEELTADNAQMLIDTYVAYTKANPDDHEQSGRYLYRAAALDYRMNRMSAAVKYLSDALKDHFSCSNTPNAVTLLHSIYKDHFKNDNIANSIVQAYQMVAPEEPAVAELSKTLPADIMPLEKRIEAMSKAIYDEKTFQIDFQTANDYILSTEAFALLNPSNEQTPGMLFKAGEIARSVRNYPKALETYDWLINKYPKHEKAGQALFLKAFTLDNDLKQYSDAKKCYEQFIKSYPENDFADDAQILLDNIGKSENEIIEQFQEEQ